MQAGADADVVLERLTELFRREFNQPALRLRPEMTGQDIPGWDSVRMVNLIFEVEDAFGFTLSGADMERLNSVGDFIAVIEANC